MPGSCIVEGCAAPVKGHGYCNKHYQRVVKYGSPDHGNLKRFMDPSTRFWRRVQKGDGCWLWTGSRGPKGYGRFQVGGRGSPHLLAHRYAFFLTHGHYPKVVMHTCDNPLCVNPSHLRGGTAKDNVRDKFAKGRAVITRALGDRNANTKLTPDDVRSIRTMRGLMSANAAGRQFGVGHKSILAIWRGITWRHVK